MRIEHLTIENYRLFKHAELRDLPGLAVFVGANGSGKSTLFDVLTFLQDALRENVQTALNRRGGFSEVVSRGSEGPIRIALACRDESGALPPMTYELVIGMHEGQPAVLLERLKDRPGKSRVGTELLRFALGKGWARAKTSRVPTAGLTRVVQELESPDILAIKGLGQFQQYRALAALRRMIEGWFFSDVSVSEAGQSQEASVVEHLSPNASNLALVARSLFRSHPAAFADVLRHMERAIPGVTSVEAQETGDGRIVLRFQDGAFQDPFLPRFVSDGTLRMFAYLLLLHDPHPHPLLCIEEPERQLYPTLLAELAEGFRDYSLRGGQVLVSTHSPDLLNGLSLDEIFWLRKCDGFTAIERANGHDLLRRLVAEGDLPGALWKQGLFAGANP